MLDSNREYRAKFIRAGEQSKWLCNLREKVVISEIAIVCSCSERTIRDWQREKFLMDFACLELLCKKYRLALPEVKKIEKFSHTKAAGSKGGKATVQRYGGLKINEQKRRDAWERWWNSEGLKRPVAVTQAKKITFPKQSSRVAEFVGIMLGDGTVAPYHLAITLHAIDDLEYSHYVTELMTELFGAEPKVYTRKNRQAIAITLARKEAVRFMARQGIMVGDKITNAIAVPKWVFSKKAFVVACTRGLMDTDGSVFDHTYKVKGKEYSYKKISFSSASKHLRKDMSTMLEMLGITFCMSGTNVRIDAQQSVERYVNVVGFHNPKHLKRIQK